jgi:hypothetical protein
MFIVLIQGNSFLKSENDVQVHPFCATPLIGQNPDKGCCICIAFFEPGFPIMFESLSGVSC